MTSQLQYAWTNPDTIYQFDDESRPRSMEWQGTGSLSGAECKIYKDEEDKTSTYMTSGSDSVSGRVQTSKVITLANQGGEDFVLRWKITEGSTTRIVQMMLKCLKSGSER